MVSKSGLPKAAIIAVALTAMTAPAVTALSTETAANTAISHTLPSAITNNLTIAQVKVFGEAKTTSWKLVSGSVEQKDRVYLIVFGKNDDLLAGLYKFIDETKIRSGHFTALGAVGCAALGFYRPQDHSYTVTKIEKSAEVASMVGNIGVKNGRAVVHSHGVFSLEDGRCLGGHIFYGSAWPTVEMTVTESQTAPIRHEDDESGLWLYDTKADDK